MDKYPVTYPSSLGVLNAEPISRDIADAGIQAAISAFARAHPSMAGTVGWSTVKDAPGAYRDSVDDLIEKTQFAKVGRPQWTSEAKIEEVRRIASAWRTSAEKIVQRVEDAADRWSRTLEAATRPPAPSSDAGVLQAMLANARTDARMVLDQSSDGELAHRLAELARTDDAALRYLVLSEWPATYFRARNAKIAPLEWAMVRRQVLAEVLEDAQVAELAKLDAMQHVRRAAQALRGGHALLIANNPEVFGRDQAA